MSPSTALPDGTDGLFRADATRRARALLIVAVLATSLYANVVHLTGWTGGTAYVPPFVAGYDANMIDHLGGEYGSIARALIAGRGFADPFQEATGPTAWMPPALPAFQAGLLATLGERGATLCVAMLQNLALIIAGWVTIGAAGRPNGRPMLAATIYILMTWYHFASCYQVTHDCWFLLILASLLVVGAARKWGRERTTLGAIGWGLFGGLVALSGPVLGLVWATVSAASALAARRFRSLAISATVAALLVAPWVARNYLVFGKFIPVKSNFAFEWYQSNRLEPDGVLRFETGATHPYRADGAERSRYLALGEARYLEDYQGRSLVVFKEDLAGYAGRVFNRFLAATIAYFPFFDREQGLLLLAAYVIHPLPFYGLAITLLFGPWRDDRLKVVSILVYVMYLSSYILVAYYERYGIPMLGLQAMFCYWGIENILNEIARRKRARSEPANLTMPVASSMVAEEAVAVAWSIESQIAISRELAEGISVVIPTLNDGAALIVLVKSLNRILPLHSRRHEVIVVIDGSDDGSLANLEALAADCPELQVVQHPKNLGYGAALLSGFRASRYELVGCIDGDAQYSPAALVALLAAREGADVVQGYRIERMEPFTRKLASHAYNCLLRALFRLPTRDTNCGARLLRLEAIRHLHLISSGAFLCAEIIDQAQRAGMRIREVDVVEYPRVCGHSRFFRFGPLLNLAGELLAYRRQAQRDLRAKPATGR